MSTKAKIVRIKSSDQQVSLSSNNGDFTVQLKDQSSMQQVRGISVVEAWIPNVFYNVRSSQGRVNNSIRFQEIGQSVVTMTILEGQYTVSQYMSAFKTAFEAASVAQTITVTQDAITQKILLETSAVCTFYSETDDPLSTGAYVLGLGTTAASGGPSLPAALSSIPNLRGYTQLYLHSKAIADGFLIDGNSGAISTAIGVSLADTPFGGMGYKQVATESEARIDYPRARNISNLRLVLRDAEGYKLDPGTSEITISFKTYLA